MSDAILPSTVVVVTFDRWPWPALGCYGHEWIDTPNWDQLAAEGFLFDRCLAVIDGESLPEANSLSVGLERLRSCGVHTARLCEVGANSLGSATAWTTVREIAGNDAADAPLAERSFARLAQAAIAEISLPAESSTPRLIWIHGVGLPEPCPVLRTALELYAADFAEDGVDLSSMTDEELVDHELTRATVLSLLDHWLGEIRNALRALSGPKWMSVSAWRGAIWEPAPRAKPLIAPFDPQEVQVPWIVTGEKIDPGRTSALVTTRDILPTMTAWLGVSAADSADAKNLKSLIAGDVDAVREAVIVRTGETGCVWTADDTTLVRTGEHDGDRDNGTGGVAQRYLWPEDGYAVNDIAAQTPDTTAERTAKIQSRE